MPQTYDESQPGGAVFGLYGVRAANKSAGDVSAQPLAARRRHQKHLEAAHERRKLVLVGWLPQVDWMQWPAHDLALETRHPIQSAGMAKEAKKAPAGYCQGLFQVDARRNQISPPSPFERADPMKSSSVPFRFSVSPPFFSLQPSFAAVPYLQSLLGPSRTISSS